MFCTGCEQHLPPGEFWSKEHGRHLARCSACRFKAGQGAFERGESQRQADDLTERPVKERKEVRYLRNLSVRDPRYTCGPYRIERPNVQLLPMGTADLLAWTFDTNPGLGRSSHLKPRTPPKAWPFA